MFYSSLIIGKMKTRIYITIKQATDFYIVQFFSEKFFAEGSSSDLRQLHPL